MALLKLFNKLDFQQNVRKGDHLRRHNSQSGVDYVYDHYDAAGVHLKREDRTVFFTWKYLFMFHEVFLIFNAKPQKEQEHKYILWCPTSTKVPKVVMEGTHSSVLKIAEEMTLRHNSEFYVCQLVAKASPVRVTTVTAKAEML